MILTLILSTFVTVATSNTSMILDAAPDQSLKTLYYGATIDGNMNPADAGYLSKETYPAFGYSSETASVHEPCISITQADGNMTLDLRVKSYTESSWEGGKLVKVLMKDTIYPVNVTVCFRSYEKEDIIETWSEISNDGKKPIVLNRYYSGCLPLRKSNIWTSTFGCRAGSDEAWLETNPLQDGTKLIKASEGIRTTRRQHAEAMISLDGKPSEDCGRVIGAALEWSGNYELRFVNPEDDYAFFLAGVCPDNAAYTLEGGKALVTPALALSFSDQGLGGVSRSFHRWGRKWRLTNGDKPRKILLNSWEGIYFNITSPVVKSMMEGTADLGAELFVLDDGWFGGPKYPRNNATMGLGDWNVNKEKLPEGIAPFIRLAGDNGIGFGIWIEPEMANTASELIEKHPDWALRAKGREPIGGRGGTQVLLDMTNPKVQKFVFDIVDNLMKSYPEIEYIKWDANAEFMEYGSPNLKYQGNLAYDFQRGVEKACAMIREAYPNVTIQACCSGGGRVNWGFLPWFDEFWTSDNTDAPHRVYMQWGTSYFFPAIAMASHVSAVPNRQTSRVCPIKYRLDVAMSGRMGFELVPSLLSEREKKQCRKAVSEYKQIRSIVQTGDLYRLLSPFDEKRMASLMYVSEDKSEAVFYAFSTCELNAAVMPDRISMRGLDPSALYRVTELDAYDEAKPLVFEGKTFSGKFLMDNGLELPRDAGLSKSLHGGKRDEFISNWYSRVLKLEIVK